jgi:hypothetical protein
LQIKKRRLSAILYSMNLIWVAGKFLGKKFFSNQS